MSEEAGPVSLQEQLVISPYLLLQTSSLPSEFTLATGRLGEAETLSSILIQGTMFSCALTVTCLSLFLSGMMSDVMKVLGKTQPHKTHNMKLAMSGQHMLNP